jgi:hypothetical protein
VNVAGLALGTRAVHGVEPALVSARDETGRG